MQRQSLNGWTGCRAMGVRRVFTTVAAVLGLALGALSLAPTAAAGEPSCFWGTLDGDKVRLCPGYDAEGKRLWRIVERRSPHHTDQRVAHAPKVAQYPKARRYDPPKRRHYDDRRYRGPKIRPRVGVTIDGDGDVRFGLGLGTVIGGIGVGVDFIP